VRCVSLRCSGHPAHTKVVQFSEIILCHGNECSQRHDVQYVIVKQYAAQYIKLILVIRDNLDCTRTGSLFSFVFSAYYDYAIEH